LLETEIDVLMRRAACSLWPRQARRHQKSSVRVPR
jgi:hypothetical protein